jgi:HAD superfamily hydrolase (TIGR01490 family)
MNLALFDLDNTLIAGDSDHAWGEYLVEEGLVDPQEFRRKNDEFFADYRDGTLDIHAYLTFALSTIAGKTEAELAPLHKQFMAKKIAAMMLPAATELLAVHRADLRVIVTATNAFVTEPIAAAFGIEHLIACEVEKSAGRYTGRPTGLPSFREGKVTRVNDWLSAMGKSLASFDKTYFYSDSQNDLPLLNIVSHPIAVDPDATLRAHAERAGWKVMSLRSVEAHQRNAEVPQSTSALRSASSRNSIKLA